MIRSVASMAVKRNNVEWILDESIFIFYETFVGLPSIYGLCESISGVEWMENNDWDDDEKEISIIHQFWKLRCTFSYIFSGCAQHYQ